jgi:hypothetical protein
MSAKRFSDYEQEEIIRAGERFIDRLQHLNPIPEKLTAMTQKDMYYSFFTPEVRAMMEYVNEVQAKLDEGPRQLIFTGEPWREHAEGVFEIPHEYIAHPEAEEVNGATQWCNVSFYLTFSSNGEREKLMTPDRGAPIILPDNEIHPVLHPYVVNWFRLNRVMRHAKKLFTRISKSCKTPGQWNTVFPQYTILLDPEKQAVISSRMRNSPWPRTLSAEIIPQISGLGELFAKCAVLPAWVEGPIRVDSWTKTVEPK